MWQSPHWNKPCKSASKLKGTSPTILVWGQQERPGWKTDRERIGTGQKDEKFVNGTHISIGKISTGKTGLPFQVVRFFREFSSGTNRKVVFYLHPTRNFRKFLVNGQSRSQSPRYPRPAVGNEGLWDKAFRIALSLAEIWAWAVGPEVNVAVIRPQIPRFALRS